MSTGTYDTSSHAEWCGCHIHCNRCNRCGKYRERQQFAGHRSDVCDGIFDCIPLQLDWFFDVNLLLSHNCCTIWCSVGFRTLTCEMDAYCEAFHRSGIARELVVVVADYGFWFFDLCQSISAICQHKTHLAPTVRIRSRTIAILLLIEMRRYRGENGGTQSKDTTSNHTPITP